MSNVTNSTEISNSTSLWKELVELPGTNFADHYAIAYLVFSFLAFFGIVYTLSTSHESYHQGVDGALRNKAFSYLRASMIFLLLSYAFQIIDIFMHQEGVYVKEGYFFTTVFRDGFWQIADLLMLLVICRVTYYQFPRWEANSPVHSVWRFACMLFLTILTALALYRWALSTAYIILALNGVAYSWTLCFVLEVAKLSTGYQITYLLLSTFILLSTAYFLVRRTRLRERLDSIELPVLVLVIVFWIRSITRADIVVKYALDGVGRPDYLITVSEALYGLPTVVIYILLNLLNEPTPSSVAQSDILRDGRRIARKELTRRRVDAANNGPPLPTPLQLLAEIESRPLSYLPDGTENRLLALTDNEVQYTLSQHIDDVMRLREKI